MESPPQSVTEKQVRGWEGGGKGKEETQLWSCWKDLKEEQGLPDRPSSELSPPHTTHFLPLCLSAKHDLSKTGSDKACAYNQRNAQLQKHTEIQKKKTRAYKQITCYFWFSANPKLCRKWAHGSDMKWTLSPLSFSPSAALSKAHK